jgi:hypothetical protein
MQQALKKFLILSSRIFTHKGIEHALFRQYQEIDRKYTDYSNPQSKILKEERTNGNQEE